MNTYIIPVIQEQYLKLAVQAISLEKAIQAVEDNGPDQYKSVETFSLEDSWSIDRPGIPPLNKEKHLQEVAKLFRITEPGFFSGI